jgi:uncharacterized protein
MLLRAWRHGNAPAADETMTTPEFSFPTSDLDAGGKAFRLPVRAAWLRGALEGTDIGVSERDGELNLRLSKSGTDVVLRGILSAELVVPCSRCLEPAVVPVREELSALAVPGRPVRKDKDRGEEEAEIDGQAEEADVINYDGETIILDDLVRDELLLGVPMIPLCSEACAGISAGRSVGFDPGAEEAGIDPRLSPLLRLKLKT